MEEFSFSHFITLLFAPSILETGSWNGIADG